MSEAKFTPGPWRFEADGDTNYAKIFCSSDPHDGDNLRGYCGKANAHLIAAAPEMYAELEAAMNVFKFYQGHHAAKGHSDKEQTNKQYADRIQKVLTKARGEA